MKMILTVVVYIVVIVFIFVTLIGTIKDSSDLTTASTTFIHSEPTDALMGSIKPSESPDTTQPSQTIKVLRARPNVLEPLFHATEDFDDLADYFNPRKPLEVPEEWL